MVYLWILSTKLLRRSWWIVALLRRYIRVIITGRVSITRATSLRGGEATKAEAIASHPEDWMNLDEIVCFSLAERKHCKKGMERMTPVVTNGMYSMDSMYLRIQSREEGIRSRAVSYNEP